MGITCGYPKEGMVNDFENEDLSSFYFDSHAPNTE
jgi:hypothetical protein